MDYEKKYKEALGWMKSLYDSLHGKTREEAERYFPELAESEDEKIRKNCIHFLELQKEHHAATFEIEECIAWLENKNKQMYVDIDTIKKKMASLNYVCE